MKAGRPWYGNNYLSILPGRSIDFINQVLKFINVFEDFGTNNGIEGIVSKWNVLSVERCDIRVLISKFIRFSYIYSMIRGFFFL